MWAGMENPCDEEDLSFFYASTTITIGNGAKTPFWDSPWLLGRKPKDIAPLIYKASKRKNWKVREALSHNAWILKIKPPTIISAELITQFFTLWALLHEVQLDDLTEDDIVWKHTASGIYSAASAYKAQFLGMVLTPLDKMVWKACPPPLPKSSSSLGWRYKTEFELPIVWQNVGGPTVALPSLHESAGMWASPLLQMPLHTKALVFDH